MSRRIPEVLDYLCGIRGRTPRVPYNDPEFRVDEISQSRSRTVLVVDSQQSVRVFRDRDYRFC